MLSLIYENGMIGDVHVSYHVSNQSRHQLWSILIRYAESWQTLMGPDNHPSPNQFSECLSESSQIVEG